MTNLLGKIVKIMEGAGYIKKDKFNNFHKYWYASEEAIKSTMHKLLVENKVIVRPIEIKEFSREWSSEETTTISDEKRGTSTTKISRNWVTSFLMTFEICDAESGEKMTVTVPASGEDKGDKGVYKAITGGEKYIYKALCCIVTGEDDPEYDGPQDEPQRRPQTAAKPQPTATPPKADKTDHSAILTPLRTKMATGQLFTADEIKAAMDKYPKVADDKKPNYIENLEKSIDERKSKYIESMKYIEGKFKSLHDLGKEDICTQATKGVCKSFDDLKRNQYLASTVADHLRSMEAE